MFTFEEREELREIARAAESSRQVKRADLRKARSAQTALENGIRRNCYLMKSYEAKVERVEPGGAEFEECVARIEQLIEENKDAAVLGSCLHRLINAASPYYMYNDLIEVID